ncbi:hypothetical protein PsalN5692_03852 (plasmid) [Piscirickettsia salmonis]|uniref:pyrimidine dimer DNA glycosylase/endonuclease V n=1 Tax=Piscirickettsia salmonis TaxID=1238 RepID=UPI0012B8067E|nr:pyrimidine dimer DNA glycosylase/endonuclease V [Piscirickettsia salmonis]QGP52343.1 hypothetical protein PsalN5692_03852 [Piscirickettsia salmonis]
MNIFYLDHNIKKCAQYHCDTHVVKMILESTQILCTVLAKTGVDTPYRPTHKNHPCTLWAEESLDNWLWLLDLTMALNSEYMYRFNRKTSHKSAIVAQSLVFPEITPIGLTERPQAMPEKYRIPDDPVSAYRQYYLAEKNHLFKYTKRNKPIWQL